MIQVSLYCKAASVIGIGTSIIGLILAISGVIKISKICYIITIPLL